MRLPGEATWTTDRPLWLTLLYIGTAIGSGILPFEIIYLRVLLGDRRARLRLTSYARMLFIEATRQSPALAFKLSVHVWKRERLPRHWTPRMVRFVTFRLVERPPSEVTWTEGKGVIGKAWSLRNVIVANLADLHATAALGRAAFEVLSDEQRFGLEWDDYQMTRDYTAIYASPLQDKRGRVIGCVTVDWTAPTAYPRLERLLSNLTARHSVRAMSRTLADETEEEA